MGPPADERMISHKRNAQHCHNQSGVWGEFFDSGPDTTRHLSKYRFL